MYTCFGLSAIFFVSHSIYVYGFAVQRRRLAIEWMALMGLVNIAGAGFYASRVCDRCSPQLINPEIMTDREQIPERWYPNRFDFVGASHQIFHCLVLVAGLVHYKALICALQEVRTTGDVCMASEFGMLPFHTA